MLASRIVTWILEGEACRRPKIEAMAYILRSGTILAEIIAKQFLGTFIFVIVFNSTRTYSL